MSEEATSDEAEPAPDAVEPTGSDVWARDTAPQTPYTMRQVGIGLVSFVIAAAVAFGVPLLLS